MSTTAPTTNRYGQTVIPAQTPVIVTTVNGGRIAGITLDATVSYRRTVGEFGASIPAPFTVDTGATLVTVGIRNVATPAALASVEAVA